MAGRTDEFKGSVKKTAGKVLGNEQMQAEGEADQLKGKSQRHAEGMKDTAVGNVKSGAGKMLGNEQMEVEGETDKLKGKVERAG